jgi:hypothetical protein
MKFLPVAATTLAPQGLARPGARANPVATTQASALEYGAVGADLLRQGTNGGTTQSSHSCLSMSTGDGSGNGASARAMGDLAMTKGRHAPALPCSRSPAAHRRSRVVDLSLPTCR